MKKEWLVPFIESTANVLSMMAQTESSCINTSEPDSSATWGDVTGLVGLSGAAINGNMSISFKRECILGVVNSMLGEAHTEITDEITDAVGELTNMISSSARSSLEKLGLDLDMALPLVIKGKDVSVSQKDKTQATRLLMKTDHGEFALDISLEEKN